MKRMKSPKPDRKGQYLEYDVPDRKVELYKVWGYVEVNKDGEPVPPPSLNRKRKVSTALAPPPVPEELEMEEPEELEMEEPEELEMEEPEELVFNLGEDLWFSVRRHIQETLNIDDLPKRKADVIAYLDEHGYKYIT